MEKRKPLRTRNAIIIISRHLRYSNFVSVCLSKTIEAFYIEKLKTLLILNKKNKKSYSIQIKKLEKPNNN